jgi:hypothetical protein
MSDERWSGERLIAEIEGVAASWHRVLDREQVSLLRGQMLNLFRRFQQPTDARITELEQEQIALWHTINTQATYAEELEAQLAQRWQPLPDGIVYHYTESIAAEWNYPAYVESIEFLEVRDNGNIIACGSMPKEDEHEANLPDNIRLCRLVTQEPTL